MSIKNMPNWVLTSDRPAFYDTESGTAIELTAKMHGKVNEVVDMVNNLEEDNTKFKQDTAKANQEWRDTTETAMRQEFQDFIDTVDMKVEDMSNKVKENVDEYLGESAEQAKAYVEGVAEEAKAELQEIASGVKQPSKKVFYDDAVGSFNPVISDADFYEYDFYKVDFRYVIGTSVINITACGVPFADDTKVNKMVSLTGSKYGSVIFAQLGGAPIISHNASIYQLGDSLTKVTTFAQQPFITKIIGYKYLSD